MSEAVEYEFGVDREKHIRSSDLILQISITAAALIWNQVAVLHDEQNIGVFTEPGLLEMRPKLADHMNSMAEATAQKTGFPVGISTRNTIARLADLENLASALSREV